MIRGQSIRGMWESLGPKGCLEHLEKALLEKKLRPEEFSFREMAVAFCGEEWYRRLNPANLDRYSTLDVQEAGEGVDVSAFANITGQIVYSKIHQGWEEAAPGYDSLFEVVPTEFDGEKIPGIGRIKSEGEAIRPGQNYPEAGFGEQYWETPSTTKHGMILSLTKEVVYFDRTNLVMKRAGEIGTRLRMNQAKRMGAVLAGITVQVGNETFNGNNHKWNGTTYTTYATSDTGFGINAKASTPLVDYTSIEAAELLFADLKDPDTLNPINIVPNCLVVMPFKRITAKRFVDATEYRTTEPEFGATSLSPPGNVTALSKNPYAGQFDVISSPLLYQLIVASGVSALNAKEWWFMTQKGKAFHYMQNWPLTVVPAAANSEAEFERDIVARWKASERGVPFMADPRYTAKLYNS